MTHRTTFALDEGTAQQLKRLAAHWDVSHAEVVRRSVEKAEQADTCSLTAEERIAAARQLRENLKGRITPGCVDGDGQGCSPLNEMDDFKVFIPHCLQLQ